MTCILRYTAYLSCLGIVLLLLAAPAQAQRDVTETTKTPLQRATEMKRNRATATDIAREMKSKYRQREDQITKILYQIDYPSAEVAHTLVKDLRVTGSETTLYLIRAGYTATDVLSALIEAGQRATTVIAIFRRTNLIAQQSAQAMKETGASAEETAQALKNAGYSPEEVAAALESTYNLPPGSLVQTMLAVDYTVNAIFRGVKNVGVSITEAVQALKDAGFDYAAAMPDAVTVYNLTFEQTVDVLQQVYDLNVTQAATAAQAFYNLTASALVTALINMGSTVGTIAITLDAMGFTLQQISDLLREQQNVDKYVMAQVFDALNVSLTEAIAEMQRLSFTMNDIGETLVDVYGVAVLPLAQALHAASFTAQSAVLVLQAGGFTTLAIMQAMAQAGYTVAAITGGLAAAGFALDVVANVLKQAGHGVLVAAEALDNAFNDPTGTIVEALKNAGYTSTEIAQALKEHFNKSANQAAVYLHDLGYSATTIARRMNDVFNRSINQTAVILKDLNYDNTDSAEALQDAYNASASAVAGALNYAGYTYDQIQDVLVDVFDMTLSSAIALLSEIGISG